MNKRIVNLVLILLLAVVVIWIDQPNHPNGIEIGSFKRTMQTQLGLDLRGGLRVVMEADLPADVPVSSEALENAKKVLESRSNALGVSENNFQTAGTRRIVGEFPGLTQTSEVISVLKETGQLAFVPMGQEPLAAGTVVQVDLTTADKADSAGVTNPSPVEQPTAAAGQAATPAPAATETPRVYKAIMTGATLESVAVSTDQLGKYQVDFVLKDLGAKIFGDFTTNHVKEYLGIILDNKVISSPQIQTSITGGKGMISGNFTFDTANNLAVQLRYGSLPVPLKIIESRTVGATLEEELIRRSVVAGIIGLTMVALYMIFLYRLPGVLASLALALYAATSFAIFKMVPVTLTLPGIAGFVLSIGVAVDANILIFERMREEMRAGRNLRTAIDLGWRRAWPSIRDSNITTLITCVILFWFGSAFGATIVKGFAVTLALGVLVSLFTAVVVTRTFLHVVLDQVKSVEHPRWFGMQEVEMAIISKRYWYFLISLVVIVPGMIALALWGLPLSIDFTGGSTLEVSFQSGKVPSTADIVAAYEAAGVKEAQVQSSSGGVLIVRSNEISEEGKNQVIKTLESKSNDKITILQFDTVGPSVGKETGSRAATAVALAAIGITLYITYAFRGVPNAYRYGIAAIVAMLHDVLVVVGIAALTDHFLGWEVDSLFLTALLTVIGFSVHDTVVVFDRIRENSNIYRRLSFMDVVNHSLVQTMGRSISTQFTVMLTLLVMALLGGSSIRHFVVILLVGVFSGTYSSIFNAAPILVVWEYHEWRDWFRPRKSQSNAA